ncbi:MULTISPECIES: VOC family protein [Micromonospora]|uniref:VOC family protein n=1 Tax=Micromonospora sicca TaxID=2202420 RepID=A0A317DK60_9ACTN|nr:MULTISPECIES: VOC family protein [unclassified Micromonospora]MBM0225504.1 VOC family protein [Micromonospora sp. ATA51]MDZ5447363.1 VOC family protein [Micromonospora sp. 4G57]MDZ5494072.1 VOC family protein [Micromonospora sp. 4G53]PWR14968.1 hypothetical protein DKT69_13460 [Micromonospora sp. 4G51]
MPTRISPYLSFNGDAREAMTFYQSVFGGDLEIATFADMRSAQDSSQDDLVAHSMLKGATGTVLFAADTTTPPDGAPAGAFSVALGGDDEAEVTGYWEGLSAGGTVTTPLARSPWGALFGRCVDKYGIAWLVNVTPAGPA